MERELVSTRRVSRAFVVSIHRVFSNMSLPFTSALLNGVDILDSIVLKVN